MKSLVRQFNAVKAVSVSAAPTLTQQTETAPSIGSVGCEIHSPHKP